MSVEVKVYSDDTVGLAMSSNDDGGHYMEYEMTEADVGELISALTRARESLIGYRKERELEEQAMGAELCASAGLVKR